MMKKILHLWPGLLLFCLSVILSLVVYQDYGLGSDEHGQSLIGARYYQYVFHGDSTFHNYIERDHGAGFELPLTMIEKGLNISDSRDIFLMRHIVSHLFFLVCMFFGYVLVLRLFNNQWLACLAFVMLVYHPRLFAQSYFNSKDIPSMGSFLVAMALSQWAFYKKQSLPYLLLGIACGYSASIRLMNLIILLPLILFCTIDLLDAFKQKKRLQPFILYPILLVTGFAVTIYTCWPTLWGNPINNLIESYESLSVFRWTGAVHFAGTKIEAYAIPWAYIPTWFVITTPELWLVLGIIGMIMVIAAFIDNPSVYLKNTPKRNFLLALFCFLAPIIIVVLLNSVLYDDWRHLYFIYPPFVVLAIFALDHLWQKKYFWIVGVLCGIQVFLIARFMIKAHPYQYVYFNYLLPHKQDYLMSKYELDYWGVSNKDGLEWVLAHSNKDSIKINNSWILGFNLSLLTPEKRRRFIQTDDESQVEYHIENFRLLPYKYPKENSIYNIEVLNSPILRITKLK